MNELLEAIKERFGGENFTLEQVRALARQLGMDQNDGQRAIALLSQRHQVTFLNQAEGYHWNADEVTGDEPADEDEGGTDGFGDDDEGGTDGFGDDDEDDEDDEE